LLCICFWTVTTAVLLKRNCGIRSDLLFAFTQKKPQAAQIAHAS